MTRFWLIRHGQSRSNAGFATGDTETIPLTGLGHRQAVLGSQTIAETFGSPELIVASPYLRAQQTAQPTRERFPTVPFETWPVQEFTYLHFSGETVYSERLPRIDAYWRGADPESKDAPGYESFNDLMARVEDCAERLRACPHATVVVFTHCRFIQLFLWRWLLRSVDQARDEMETFWGARHLIRVPNLGYVQGDVLEDGTLSMCPIQTIVEGELATPLPKGA